MPPEEVGQLLAIDFKLERDSLVGDGIRVYSKTDHLRVSWYSGKVPITYKKICEGVASVKKSTMQNYSDKVLNAHPTKIGNRYVWRDTANQFGLMMIMILPAGYTIVNPNPIPEESKVFQDRVALFWILWPSDGENTGGVEIEWGIKPVRGKVHGNVEEINKTVREARQRKDSAEYDVALSFAGEDREYVEKVANLLRTAGVKVFYDQYEQVFLWGKNLYDHLSEIYGKRAKYTVMFISKHYRDKVWTNFERQTAQARAFSQHSEYILPARFDNTEVPGMLPTITYVSLKRTPPHRLANMIISKLQISS